MSEPASTIELNTLKKMTSQEILSRPPASSEEMTKQALAVAMRPDFMERIDQEIGEPRAGETREDFISRGEQTIIAGLKAILG